MSGEGRRAVLDVFRKSRAGAEQIGRRQRQQLDGMIRHARSRSPFYRELYADLPGGVPDLSQLPLVTKPQLMEHFDEVVTDRAVTHAGLDPFLGGPGNIGQPFLGRYLAATSSGQPRGGAPCVVTQGASG